MATILQNRHAHDMLQASRTYLDQQLERLRAHRERNRIYRTTMFELSSLTDRDLRDLGIPRGDIWRLATEAANAHR